MSNRVELNLGMKAVGEFESPMRKFNGLTEEAVTLVGKFGKEMLGLQHQKRSIRIFEELNVKTSKLKKEQHEASKRAKELKEQINAAGKPTKKLIRDYKSATNKLDRLTEAHKKSRSETAKRLGLLKKEGINTRRLAQEQSRLGDAYADTEKRAKAFGETQKRVIDANARFDNISQRAANAALISSGVSRAGQGLINTVASPTRSAMGFEDAMTEVDKFVKGANIPELSKQIRELGGSSPIGAVGIANLVAAGGKINLNAQDALKFAQISEQQSVAYGISVDEAANTITKIRTGMNLSIDEIRQMGDAINYLGDNSGSNAPNINTIVSRIGAVGKASGLANAEIAGLAAVIDSAAPNAETAATSMKNILTALTGGEQLSGRQKDILNDLGLDATDLAESMQENASKTIEEVLLAISSADAADRNGIINGLFGRESQAAVANMVGNLAEYRKVMNAAADTSKFAGSTNKEYTRDLDKTSTKLKIQMQAWEEVKIQLGEKLLPIIGSITETLKPVVSGISNFIETHPTLAKWAIIAAGGLGVAAVAIAPVVTGLYAMAAAAAWASKQFAANAAAQAAGGLMGGGKGKGGKFGKFGKGLGVLGAGLGVLSIGSTLMDDELSAGAKTNQVATTGGGLAGAWAGAKGGAMAGALLGPVGAAIGGLIGGGLGFAAGSWLGGNILSSKSGETKIEAAEKAKQRAAENRKVVKSEHIVDNSQVQITVQGSDNPEETANLVMKKLHEDKRRRRRNNRRGNELYDTAGALPA